MASFSHKTTVLAALLFDLDGTLVNSPEANRAGIAAAALEAERRTGVSGSTWRAANAQAAKAVMTRSEPTWVSGLISSTDLSAEIYRSTLKALDRDVQIVDDLVRTHEHAQAATLRAYDDVPEVLAYAASQGIHLAIVSNGPSLLQRELLDVTGLARYFDVVVTAGELGIGKPDPRIFQVALTELGIHAENAWHIGDSLGEDVAGARAAGVHAIWLNRSGRSGDHSPNLPTGSAVPDRMIMNVSELPLRQAQGASSRSSQGETPRDSVEGTSRDDGTDSRKVEP